MHSLDSQIPGNTKLDKQFDAAVEAKDCKACVHCDKLAGEEPCNACFIPQAGLWDRFEAIDDLVLFQERMGYDDNDS